MRMKAHMHAHVDRNRHTMFNNAADTVRDQLQTMCDRIYRDLLNYVLQNIFNSISQDYLSVLGTDHNKDVSVMTRTERMLRGEMALALAEEADVAFKHCVPRAESPAPDEAAVQEPAELAGYDPFGVEEFDDEDDEDEHMFDLHEADDHFAANDHGEESFDDEQAEDNPSSITDGRGESVDLGITQDNPVQQNAPAAP